MELPRLLAVDDEVGSESENSGSLSESRSEDEAPAFISDGEATDVFAGSDSDSILSGPTKF